MSVSSNSRKGSSESNASKQMHSTMGIHPELGLSQLNDQNLGQDLPSKAADNNDLDVPENLTVIKDTIAEQDDNNGMTNQEIEESRRASWGQPPLPADAEDASVDQNDATTAHQRSVNDMPPPMTDRVSVVNTTHSTNQGAIPATHVDEPDRTLGNS